MGRGYGGWRDRICENIRIKIKQMGVNMQITLEEIKLSLADMIIERDAWMREAQKQKERADNLDKDLEQKGQDK